MTTPSVSKKKATPTAPKPATAPSSAPPKGKSGTKDKSGRATKKAKATKAKRKASKAKASKHKASKPKRGRAKAKPDPTLCTTTGALLAPIWEARFRTATERALAEGAPLTLALIDVDEFRRHQAELETERADALLKGLVSRLSDAFADELATGEALLGRLAGDLFALTLPHELEEALGLLALARKQIQRSPLKVGRGVRRREVSATLSAGLGSLRRDGTRPEDLIGAAQGALWRAKSLGGDRLGIPDKERMTLKSSYYPQTQLDQLKALARRNESKESTLLREALYDLFLKYKGRSPDSPIG
ncbi:MAG: diguanylate cyclase [Planctomycetes bacterium]|nr:diguanylate cyclase [Planctomycetota bacterium]